MMKRLISTYSLHIFVTLCLMALGNFSAFAQGTQLITAASQFSSNASDEEQGLNFDDLIDNNVATFWTSDWHGRVAEEHYLQVNLNSPVQGYINLVTKNRTAYNNEVPTKLKIKASLNGTDWTTIEENLSLQTSAAGAESTVPFYLPSAYSYLRFTTVANNNNGQISGGRYILNFAEFQLYSLSSDPIRNQLTALKPGLNQVIMKITNMPGGTYYMGSNFRPTTEETKISIYKDTDGKLYLVNSNNDRMTYLIYGDMFRDAIIREHFYRRDDWSKYYTIPQMQYLCGAKSKDTSVEHSPYITVSGSEHNLEWGTGHDGKSWAIQLGDELWPQTYTPYNKDTYNNHWISGADTYFHYDTGTSRWEKYDQSTNTWNVRLKGGIDQDWKAMLYLKPNLSADINKDLDYTFSCTITSDKDITNVIVKFQDSSDNSNNMFETKIAKIEAGKPYNFVSSNHYMSKASVNRADNHAELVVSFGGTPGKSTDYINVDISNISLKPVTRQGTWDRQARRFCQIDIDNENYLRFILKDDMLQNNSGPMNATDANRIDENIFKNKGADWAFPLYFIADKTNETEAKDYLRAGVSKTGAIQVLIDADFEYDFVHYRGDVYDGKVGTTIPDNLIYIGGDYKTHADDGRILPEADPIQRTHEYEREVWVFPGVDYELLPYSDFKGATQYEEKYVRWYDYSTGKKSSHIYPDGQFMIDFEEGLIGYRDNDGKRDYATHMIYRAADGTTTNIWPAHPAMTHIYTPGGVDFSAFSYPEITSATRANVDGSDSQTFSKGGDGHIKVTFNNNNKRQIFLDQHPTYQNGSDYLLTLKVKSSVDMTGVELYPLEKEYVNSKGETIQGFDKTPLVFNLTAGVEKILEYRYSEGPNNLTRIWFDNVISQNGATFEIYDIDIKESKTKQEPLSIEQKANSYKFTVTATNERWRAIVDFRELDIDIDKHSDYKFRFTINSSAALKIKPGSKTNGVQDGGIFVKIEDVTDGGNFLFDRIVEIEDSEVGQDKEVEITVLQSEAVNLKKTDNKWKLLFDFGSNPAATVEIKDIVLLESTASSNAELLDIIAMDASCSFDKTKDIEVDGNKTTIKEPNLNFRNIFVVRNAKLRADIISDKTKGQKYVQEHTEQLMAPAGKPFQYRLSSNERWDFPNDYETDFWYKKGNTGDVKNDYAAVHHYLIETWKDGVYLGSTINFKDGEEFYGGKPSNIDKLAMLYKNNNYVDRVFYIKSPEEGHYVIKFYAIENSLANNTSGANGAVPIYYYGMTASPENRMLLMEYNLDILGPKEGNMILETELMDAANDALYAHQRPAKMVELYGKPTTQVNFDDLDPAKCELDANGDGYYKWPRKWEESSYGFPYNPVKYDYNMYVVANKSTSTHYHEAAGNDVRDRAYIESGGKKKGFFYYTNAAGDPGRMTVLNIGKDFCSNSVVYVSAWVMEFSKTYETANVVFAFKGVDANGYETTLSSFVTGYVTGGDNTSTGFKDGGSNPDNRGKWHHVYYSFTPQNISGKTFDHYIISVENNCVSSSGADYAIDDIRAFVCKPVVYARQSVPICNGDKTTNLILTAEYEQIMDAFGFSKPADKEHGATAQFDYCFVDKAKYDEGMKNYASLTNNEDRKACYEKAFDDALIHDAYGPSLHDYGILDFNTWFESNTGYDPEAYYNPDDPDAGTFLNKATRYTDTATGKRFLVFPSYASDGDMNVGSEYIVAMHQHGASAPGALDFQLYDGCSSFSEFEVITSGQVKIDGELASDQNDASVCANQIPEIKIDMSGIGNLGTIQTTENAYFDWFKGPKTGSQYYKKAPDACTENQGSCSPLFSWDTDNDGNVIITISAGEGTDGLTKFRNTGMNGTFSLNGNVADFNTYFNKGKKDDYTYALTLKNPANKPATGASISYAGEIECMSSLHDNDWSKYSFSGYTYGAEAEENYDYASYGGVLLDDALAKFRSQYADADKTDFNDCTTNGTYLQTHRDCIKHFLDEGKITLYKNTEFLSTYDEYQKVTDPDEQRKFYLTALPINPTPDKPDLKYCLEPFEIVLKLSTRTPRMKNGDDSGRIPYPADMRDVPLRIGLKQLNRVRMADLNDEHPANFLYMPLREVTPATTGVTSLIQKSQDDYVYLVASTDPNVAAGESGAVEVTGYTTSDIKVIGKVSIIKALPGKGLGNVCHLNFLSGFKFREGYDYTIKFKFEENYTGVVGDHSDVCPGDVVCTIKVVPEYLMWTGAVDSNWNNDGNWRRVTKAELLGTAAATNDLVTDGGTNANTDSFVPADFTNVIIPADAVRPPKLHDLRRGTASADPNNASTNMTIVRFAGNSKDCDYIKDMTAPTNIGDATDRIKFHMSSVDMDDNTDGSDDNVACRSWYDHTCKYIHFDAGAQMLSQQYLHYEKAWADFEMEPNKWTTISSPLINVVSGDLYLPTATARQDTPLFEDITFNPALHDRFHPAVFQRTWNAANAKVMHLNGDVTSSMVDLDWSQVYNDGNVNYTAGVGFAIKPDVSMMGSNKISSYVNKEIGHFASPTADVNSFVLLSIYSDGSGHTTVEINQDIAKNSHTFDYLQVTGLGSTSGTGQTSMSCTFITPTPDASGNITLEILWSTDVFAGNWMVQNVVVPANAVLPGGPGAPPAKVKFRLPKADTNYHYWNPNHQDGNVHDEDVPNEMLDGGNRTHKLADLNNIYAQPVVQNGQNVTSYYLVGNPMMCYLNMQEFFKANRNFEEKYWIVTGQGQQYAEMDENTAGFVGTVANTYVAPFQSFFVKVRENPTIQNDGTIKPKFDFAMMAVKKTDATSNRESFESVIGEGNGYERDDNGNLIIPGNNDNPRPDNPNNKGGYNEDESPVTGNAKQYVLSITATDGNDNSSSVILTDGLERKVSGVEALFDSNLRMSGCPMLYTTKNHEAMSLTQILPGDTIPVALSNVRGEVTLKIKGADTFETPLYLIDATTGETVPLTNDVVLTQEENGVKYYIAAEPTEIEDVPTSGLPQIITEGNTLIVKAPADAEIDYIRIYKIDGITVATDEHVGDTFTITLPHNVYIIDIVCNGHRQTVKISM